MNGSKKMRIIGEKYPETILLTGATGRLGSALAAELIKRGFRLICLKRSFSNTARVESIIHLLTWYNIDETSIEEIFKLNEIDIVIHTATYYGRSISDYFEAYRSNLIFPLELFELTGKYNCKLFINTGSYYEKEINNLLNIEGFVYLDSYVKSKYFFKQITQNHINEMNISFVNMQLEHIYAADDERKFVNRIIKDLINQKETIELSEGRQLRDWIFIDDVIAAYVKVVETRKVFEKGSRYWFEVGTGQMCSLREFVETAKRIIGSNSTLDFGSIPMNNEELDFSVADITGLIELGWKPNYSIREGIKALIDAQENQDKL